MTFCFKILKLSLFINFAFLYNVKQTKTNLQKYFTPPPKTTIYSMCARAMTRAKKGQKKGTDFKEDKQCFAPLGVITS